MMGRNYLAKKIYHEKQKDRKSRMDMNNQKHRDATLDCIAGHHSNLCFFFRATSGEILSKMANEGKISATIGDDTINDTRDEDTGTRRVHLAMPRSLFGGRE